MRNFFGIFLLGVFLAGVTSVSAIDVASSAGSKENTAILVEEVNKTKQNVDNIGSCSDINLNSNIGVTLNKDKDVKESKAEKDISFETGLCVEVVSMLVSSATLSFIKQSLDRSKTDESNSGKKN